MEIAYKINGLPQNQFISGAVARIKSLAEETAMEQTEERIEAWLAALGAKSARAKSGAAPARDFDPAQATPLERILWVLDESEPVERRIDALLDAKNWAQCTPLIDALARAAVAWEHPTILAALERDDTREAAALVATRAVPDEVDAWLDACEVIEDALQVMRAVSLAAEERTTRMWPALLQWHDAIMQLDQAQPERAHASGALATLDPTDWARRALGDDAEDSWVLDPQNVADFLATHGPTTWLATLTGLADATHLEPGRSSENALEFGMLLAAAAALGLTREAPTQDAALQELARAMLALLQLPPEAALEDWQPRATRAGLGALLALTGGDPDANSADQLGLLLVQIAAHEWLVTHDFHSPGIPGLPFSTTSAEDVNLDAAADILAALTAETPDSQRSTPVQTVLTLRCLTDLEDWQALDAARFAPQAHDWAHAFATHGTSSIRHASTRLQQASQPADSPAPQPPAHQTPTSHPGADLLHLGRARRLARAGTEASLEELATLWATADLWRADFYRDCLFEALTQE